MLKIERVSVMNLENAIRGARNPMNSWHLSDSHYDEEGNYVLGEKDLDLAGRLCRAGSDHRKFVRMIFVSMDVTALCTGGRNTTPTKWAPCQFLLYDAQNPQQALYSGRFQP